MDRDSKKMRESLPFIFTNLLTGQGLDQVLEWVQARLSSKR
jgi:urease accessory protein